MDFPSAHALALVESGSPIRSQSRIDDPIDDPLATPDFWLDAGALSEIADIAQRVAQKVIKSRKWRGADLVVRMVQIGRGGAGGKALQVHVDSLPPDLREAWYLSHGIKLHEAVDPITGETVLAPEKSVATDKRLDKRLAVARWRHDVIKSALAIAPRTSEREQAILELAAIKRLAPNGKIKKVSRAQIHRWIKSFNEAGLYGLMPKENAGKGTSQTIVTRVWDGFFAGHIDQQTHRDVGEEVVGYIRSLWASGERGKYAIAEKATTRLIEISRGLGVIAFEALPLGQPVRNGAPGTQFSVCHVNSWIAERERSYQVVAVKNKDNAAFQDEHMPHIRRDYSDLKPGDIIVGDVHPTDVMMRREDGREVYPKAIAWLDVATNAMHMTFVLCEKGESIRREHVAMAFEAMVTEWGLPKMLYLDNGAEYSWHEMIRGFTELSKLTAGRMSVYDLDDNPDVSRRVLNSREAIVRSLAYNAKGKPKIEGAFGNIEQVQFALMPGWTAGERMRKKTHAKGKAPKPFPGTAKDFLGAASTLLEWYHKRPQHGRLNGRSPNETLRAFTEAGWGKTVLADPKVLKLAFSEEVTRTPKSGRVSHKNRFNDTTYYYADELLAIRAPITLRVPAFDPQFVFCFEGERFLCTAHPEKTFGVLDPAGSAELGRRRRVFLREISDRAQHCALLDLVDETRRHNQHLPDAPEVPVAAVVKTDLLTRMAEIEAREQAEREAERDATRAKAQEFDPWGTGENAYLERAEEMMANNEDWND